MNKLNIMIIGQDCVRYLKMCLEAVKGENIIYLDGGSKDKSIELAKSYGAKIIENKFNQEDKLMMSKQKNFFLEYLKKNHMGEWVLYLDADEVVSDISKVKEFINNPPEELKLMISIKMRHFENTFGVEDAIEKVHFVPSRLFLVSKEMYFPDGEHTVLWIKKDGIKAPKEEMKTSCASWKGVTIWHLAYCSGLFDIRKRYLNHLKKSEIHTKDYMDSWYFSHLFGTYPISAVQYIDIPHVILKEFLIEPDKIYFMTHNQLELKHFLMMRDWKIYYNNPKTLLDLGCGVGLFGFAADGMGIEYRGMEGSQWAVDNTTFKHLNITQGNIRDKHDFKDFDVVLVFDVLEHLEEEDLDITLENIKGYGKNFLFSIPFLGENENLHKDPTHKIFKEKKWWINKLTNHFKIKPTPDTFEFNEQIVLGVPK